MLYLGLRNIDVGSVMYEVQLGDFLYVKRAVNFAVDVTMLCCYSLFFAMVTKAFMLQGVVRYYERSLRCDRRGFSSCRAESAIVALADRDGAVVLERRSSRRGVSARPTRARRSVARILRRRCPPRPIHSPPCGSASAEIGHRVHRLPA